MTNKELELKVLEQESKIKELTDLLYLTIKFENVNKSLNLDLINNLEIKKQKFIDNIEKKEVGNNE